MKVAFPHPDEFSKTADHATIKQETRQMSKRAYASVAAAILGADIENGEEAASSAKKRDSSEVLYEIVFSISGVQPVSAYSSA